MSFRALIWRHSELRGARGAGHSLRLLSPLPHFTVDHSEGGKKGMGSMVGGGCQSMNFFENRFQGSLILHRNPWDSIKESRKFKKSRPL